MAWGMPLAVFIQIGLAFFGVPLPIHGALGAVIVALAVLLLRRGLRPDTADSQRLLTVLLAGLIGLQSCLIALGAVWPVSLTLHAINAFVILAAALALALDAEDGSL